MYQEEERIEDALLDYLTRSGSWVAARSLAGRYFGEQNTKFITCLKHEGRWIAVQWVTTSSKLFDLAPRVYPGRVGISRRKPRAFRRMVQGKWQGVTAEPSGLTIGVQIYVRLGNSHV